MIIMEDGWINWKKRNRKNKNIEDEKRSRKRKQKLKKEEEGELERKGGGRLYRQASGANLCNGPTKEEPLDLLD